jgi:hypothetical protein
LRARVGAAADATPAATASARARILIKGGMMSLLAESWQISPGKRHDNAI